MVLIQFGKPTCPCLTSLSTWAGLPLTVRFLRYHGDRPSSVPEEDRFRKAGLPGGPGIGDSFLDVLHPADGHREVPLTGPSFVFNVRVFPLVLMRFYSVCRRFSHNLVAQLWYLVKCVYFGLSAYQIRSGYPTRVLGNFLTKSYNYVNLFLFQG